MTTLHIFKGSVAKSTHAGIPWLRYLHQNLGDKIQFWPFDGWDISNGKSAIVEVYPSLWSRSFAREDHNQDQNDAYSVASWLRQADLGRPEEIGQVFANFQQNLYPPQSL